MEEKSITGGVPPLFFKHRELGLGQNEKLSVYELCKELYKNDLNEDDIEGAQRIKGLWRVYMNSAEKRTYLYANGFFFRNISVTLYDQNPFIRNEENEDPDNRCVKVYIQNLPLSVSNVEVQRMLRQYGCNIENEVKYEYERDENHKLTKIKNGDRSVLVNEEDLLQHHLPRTTWCGLFKCRIYYKGQPRPVIECYNCFEKTHFQHQCKNERCCKVCRLPGHFEGSENCAFYKPTDVVAFMGKDDLLSNFHESEFKWKNNFVNTVEKAYAHETAIANNRIDLANDIMRAGSGKEVKKISKTIYKKKEWEQDKVKVMKAIIKEKVIQVKGVRECLLATGNKVIAEAVPGDGFWSCGLSKTNATKTDPQHWPGKNVLGKLYMELRDEIIEEEKNDFRKVTSKSESRSAKRKPSSDSTIGNATAKVRDNGTTPPKIANNIS